MPGGNGPEISRLFYDDTFNCRIEENLIEGTRVYAVRIGGGEPGSNQVHDILVRGNQVVTDFGTQYFLHPDNGGNITWLDNFGEGSAKLKDDEIQGGVEERNTTMANLPEPLKAAEVGPRWLCPTD